HPPSYQPSSKIPQELFDKIIANEDNFLWPEEVKLFGQVLNNNLPAIATQDSERGVLREDYFSDYIIPLVDHEPWVEKNIPIPPGERAAIIDAVKAKIQSGVYEPSQASYRSRWFWVKKKSG
ncbi:hypothetical protein SISNIDRAFT_391122, partial [Sistotremastrum niveocremeum HHB9708]